MGHLPVYWERQGKLSVSSCYTMVCTVHMRCDNCPMHRKCLIFSWEFQIYTKPVWQGETFLAGSDESERWPSLVQVRHDERPDWSSSFVSRTPARWCARSWGDWNWSWVFWSRTTKRWGLRQRVNTVGPTSSTLPVSPFIFHSAAPQNRFALLQGHPVGRTLVPRISIFFFLTTPLPPPTQQFRWRVPTPPVGVVTVLVVLACVCTRQFEPDFSLRHSQKKNRLFRRWRRLTNVNPMPIHLRPPPHPCK